MEEGVYSTQYDPGIRDLVYFVLKGDWRFEFVDRRIVDLTGHEPEDFTTGKTKLLDIVHKQDRSLLKTALKKALRSDRYYAAEFRIWKKHGGIGWVRMRGPVCTGEQGELLRIRGVMNDITPRKESEAAFEMEREILLTVANRMDDGIYLLAEDCQIELVNEALVEMLGGQVSDTSCESILERQDLFTWSVLAAANYDNFGFQDFQVSEGGKTYHVRTSPIQSHRGPKWKLGVIKDITKIRKLQSNLKDFSLQLRAIEKAANIAQLGIFVLENVGGIEARFRSANEAFCKIIGYNETELLKMSVSDLIHADDVEIALDRYRRRLKGETFNDAYELRMIRKDGVLITVLFMGARTRRVGKEATVCFLRDITMKKELQRSLELSHRLASIGKLSAEFAHEINNPLTSILTFSKLIDRILSQNPLPKNRVDELREYVNFVTNEAKRCADISRNLLDFSRSCEISTKEYDVHEILDKSLRILRHRAEMGGIKIVTAYGRDIPKICCDFGRIQQVFVNLFLNGIEAMSGNGVLSVETAFEPQQQCHIQCKSGKNMVRITITDTGVGISEENLGRVFEPFFSTKGEKSGVGLGLSVAYGIIKKHQGEVHVRSEIGRGTCFVIHLPTEICPTCSFPDD